MTKYFSSEFILSTSAAPLFGIDQGDKLVLELTKSPQNGELVLMSKDGESNVYRYETASGRPTIWPGNEEVRSDASLLTIRRVIRKFLVGN
jgi:SOS-response transcriptional repressor LexA